MKSFQVSRGNNLVFIGFSFWHHGAHSGYDLIRHHVRYSKQFDFQKAVNSLYRIPEHGNIFTKLYLVLFGDRPWWIEFKIIFYLLSHKNQILHFIYPENLFRYAGLFKGRSNRIVCTFHQPPRYYIQGRFHGKKSIDKIIVLSYDMVEPVQRAFPKTNVQYIPHGVDTEYFKPRIPRGRTRSVLIVGNWMRNFEFANKVVQILTKKDDRISVIVVTRKQNHGHFEKLHNLKLLSGIDDSELLNLYQTCGVLFLPLNGFTANNALLEGASCGCPVVVASDQKSENCYFNHQLVDFVPFDPSRAADSIIMRLNHSDESREESLISFVRDNYDWKIIGARTETELYKAARD